MARGRPITLLATTLLTAATTLLLQPAAWATPPSADPTPNTGSNSADPNADGTGSQPAPDTTLLPNGTAAPDRPAYPNRAGTASPDRAPLGETRARGIAPALLPAQPAGPDGSTPSTAGRTATPSTPGRTATGATPSAPGRTITGTPSALGRTGTPSALGRTGAASALGRGHAGAPRAATPGTYPAPNGSADAPAPAATSTQLTIVIAKSTVAGHNGTFTLTCAPTGGTHPDPVNACAKLDQFAAAGQDPFTPTPANQTCSMLYSGPATAHITGTWRGRRIDTTFARANSCQTARWNNLLPLLSPESAT